MRSWISIAIFLDASIYTILFRTRLLMMKLAVIQLVQVTCHNGLPTTHAEDCAEFGVPGLVYTVKLQRIFCLDRVVRRAFANFARSALWMGH